MTDTAFTWAALQPAITEIALASAICLILMIDVFAGQKRRGLTSLATLVALAATAWLTVQVGWVNERTLLFGGLYVADQLAVWIKLCACLTLGLALFYGEAYGERRRIRGGEYYVLALT